MKNSVLEKTEKIKTIIDDSALKSKEAVKEIISMNNKYLGQALDSNKKIVDEIKQQFQLKDHGAAFFETLNKAFGKSVELSEETIDGIVEAYNKQVELYVDYNTKLVDAIKETAGYSMNLYEAEKLLKLIHDSFEESLSSMSRSLKVLIDSYNKHTNLALNFNQKFGENVNAQMQLFRELQQNNASFFSSWATEWWKQSEPAK
jgi:hypothetical protein